MAQDFGAAPPRRAGPYAAASEHKRQRIVGLIWLYFVLLMVEGALRKWVFPQWSDALLIVRDPVAAAILYLGVRDGYLPRDGLVRSLGWLLIGFLVLSAVQLLTYGVPVAVLLFGLRTHFLHPPVIFVMACVLDGRDLRRLAMATLLIAVPIAFLMVAQFRADPSDWINKGAGEGRLQILSAMGKVRPAGPFSFISGPVFFFSLMLACLIASHLNRIGVPAIVQASGWAALFIATAVSGSRALAFGLVPVLLATAVALVKRPRLVGRFVRGALMATAIIMTVWSSSAVQEGLEVFDARIQEAGGRQNIIERSRDTYLFTASAWNEAPALGLGIGLGTNAGNALVSASAFRFGESEWTRVLYEAGWILGTAYLGWRVWLCGWLLRRALNAVSIGWVLGIAAFGASLTNLMLGPWGQPTTQGFAVFAGGLCFASCRAPATNVLPSEPAPAIERSPLARRLAPVR